MGREVQPTPIPFVEEPKVTWPKFKKTVSVVALTAMAAAGVSFVTERLAHGPGDCIIETDDMLPSVSPIECFNDIMGIKPDNSLQTP